MKTSPIGFFLALLLACAPGFATPPAEAGPTGSMPDVLSLPAQALAVPLLDVRPDGATPRALGEWRQPGGLLIVFLSNSCPYVLDWSDRIPRLAGIAADRGIGVALVNANGHTRKRDDSPEEMRAFAEKYLGGHPYLLDEDSRLADILRAERTPEAFLYDGQLRLIYRGPFDDHSGPFDQVGQHWLSDAIDSLKQGTAAPESQPALGCSIQRARRRPLPPLPENPGPG